MLLCEIITWWDGRQAEFPELFALSGSGELGPALVLSSLAEKSFGLEQSISDLSMQSTHLCQVKMQVLIRR